MVPKGTGSGRIIIAGVGGQAQSTEDFLVDVLSPEEAIRIYPNPTDGRFMVDVTKADYAVEQVRVYNAVGELLWSQTLTGIQQEQLSVELSNYKLGLFVVVVQTEQGTVVRKLTIR